MLDAEKYRAAAVPATAAAAATRHGAESGTTALIHCLLLLLSPLLQVGYVTVECLPECDKPMT
jgi:hypothetical protein